MAYTAFNTARPDVAAGGATRTSEINYARSNDNALRDMLAAFAGAVGFNVSITAGTVLKPTTVLATNSNQVLKKVITYGAGVTADLPVTVVYSKSVGGVNGTYDSIATVTYSYDANGDFTGSTWS